MDPTSLAVTNGKVMTRKGSRVQVPHGPLVAKITAFAQFNGYIACPIARPVALLVAVLRFQGLNSRVWSASLPTLQLGARQVLDTSRLIPEREQSPSASPEES